MFCAPRQLSRSQPNVLLAPLSPTIATAGTVWGSEGSCHVYVSRTRTLCHLWSVVSARTRHTTESGPHAGPLDAQVATYMPRRRPRAQEGRGEVRWCWLGPLLGAPLPSWPRRRACAIAPPAMPSHSNNTRLPLASVIGNNMWAWPHPRPHPQAWVAKRTPSALNTLCFTLLSGICQFSLLLLLLLLSICGQAKLCPHVHWVAVLATLRSRAEAVAEQI